MKIIDDHFADQKVEIGERQSERRIIASKNDDGRVFTFSVAPGFVIASIESYSNIALGGTKLDSQFMASLKLTDELFTMMEVSEARRAGFRVYDFSLVGKPEGVETHKKFFSMVDAGLTSAIAGEGKSLDMAYTLQGEQADGTSFNVSVGPGDPEDFSKRLEDRILSERLNESEDIDFVADVDFYQSNMPLKGSVASRWLRGVASRSVSTVANIKRKLVL
tara:strand:- start:22737 stop:23396 length:660 start_codon:yes stop_codon:yes gene_type:complete